MTDVGLNADTSNALFLVATTARKTWAIVRFIQQILPFAVFALALLAWQLTVRINNIPHYILPAPTLVLKTLWDNLSSLMVSWFYTIKSRLAPYWWAVWRTSCFVRPVGTNGWKLQNHLVAAAQYEQRDPRRLRCICQQSYNYLKAM